MKKKNNATRYFAIFMLALIAIFAIALIVFGGYIFKFVIIDRNFWFDLSAFSTIMQSFIMLITGCIGAGLFSLGIMLMVNLIGEKNIMKFLSIFMD